MTPGGRRALAHGARDPVLAADQFEDDVDIGLDRHRGRVVVPGALRKIDAAVPAPVPRGYRDHVDRASAPRRDEIAARLQDTDRRRADRAEAGDGNPHRRGQEATARRGAGSAAASASTRKRRRLRAACRMRCRFSTRAMREPVAVFAEAEARRHRDVGLGQEQLREFERAEMREPFGYRSPGEHRRGRRRYLPAGLAEALDQHVPGAAVGAAHLVRRIPAGR